jgi:DNA invertase Pin-like site-specific DNA recombinase
MKREIKRAALYVRVSTPDKQHPANQVPPLREWCRKLGWAVAIEYVDRESGGHANRAHFQRMMEDAARRHFDVVVCWSLDRFSREGIAPTFAHLKRLHENGVGFVSITEEYFRTTGPAADLLIAVVAWVAEFERRRRQERVKAGMDRARLEGKHLGRHRTDFSRDDLCQMVAMQGAGVSLRVIAEKFKTSKSMVGRRIAETVAAGKKADGNERNSVHV